MLVQYDIRRSAAAKSVIDPSGTVAVDASIRLLRPRLLCTRSCLRSARRRLLPRTVV
jgi:hypothetical protein